MEAAEKFVAFWVSQFNVASRTADPGPIEALSSAECPGCQQMISDTQKLRDSGKHVGGDLWTLNDKYLEKFDNASSAVVIANVRQNPAPVLEAMPFS